MQTEQIEQRLEAITQMLSKIQERVCADEKYQTVSRTQACKILSVSLLTLDRMIKAGKLKARRLNGRIVILLEDVQNYLEKNQINYSLTKN